METRAHYVTVGLFTVIVAAAALLFSLWLNSQGNEGGHFKAYNVLFNEAVNGLSEGSAVQYSGIKVGEVTQLRLDNNDPSKVWARIRVRVNTPIRQDTKARLMITSITGSAAIQLSSARADSPDLIAKDNEIPTIMALPSPLNQLLNNGQDLMAGVNELLGHSKMMLSTENINNFSSSLHNMQQVTAALAKEQGNITTLITQLTEASKNVAALSKDAHQMLGGLGKEVMNSAAASMHSIEELSSRLNQLLTDNQQSLNSGADGLAQLGPTLIELRKTIAALRTVVDRVQDNPGGYLVGQERVKEFAP